MLHDFNTFKDLANEWGGVSVDSVRRWFKRWGRRFHLKVKRPSARMILIERSEAERFWKLIEAEWRLQEEQAGRRKPEKQGRARRR